MRQTPTSSRYPFTLASTAAWAACLLALTGIGLVHGGLSCWLQDTIYLLAALPLGTGVTSMLRYRWTGRPEARPRGIIYVIVAWTLIVDAWFSVTAHRKEVARREAALQPVITALGLYRRAHGAYPDTLAALNDDLPSGRVFYTAFGGSDYFLSFRHNLTLSHRYLPAEQRWVDDFPRLGP